MTKKQALKENLKLLPLTCFAVQHSSGKLIEIWQGRTGYREISEDWVKMKMTELDAGTTQELADKLNSPDRVTPAQVEAMICGSMFGFHVPAANPLNWTGPKHVQIAIGMRVDQWNGGKFRQGTIIDIQHAYVPSEDSMGNGSTYPARARVQWATGKLRSWVAVSTLRPIVG